MSLIRVKWLELLVCLGCIAIILIRGFFGYNGHMCKVITRPVRHVVELTLT